MALSSTLDYLKLNKSEPQSMMTLQQSELDDYVPLEVVKEFARDFIASFIKLMFDLGFDTKEEMEGKKKHDLRNKLLEQIREDKKKT